MGIITGLSYWESQLLPADCDVCIIGGGFTGAWTAFFLSRLNPGIRIVILEEMTISRGASTRNAGFLCYGSPTEILEDIETMGEVKALGLVRDRYMGLRKIQSLVPPGSASISWNSGYELFTKSQSATYDQVLNKLSELNESLKSVIGRDPYSKMDSGQLEKLASGHSKAIKIEGEGQVHPASLLKYINQLNESAGVRLLEGFRVENLKESAGKIEIETNRNHRISSSKVLIATNGFYSRLFPQRPTVLPARNQVLLLKLDQPFRLEGSWHSENGYIYFRSVNGMLLIGGGRHWYREDEVTDIMQVNEEIINGLKEYAQTEILPSGSRIKEYMSWSGIMGVGSTKDPVFEWTSNKILSVVRLSGMGVALSPVLGEKAANELYRSLNE
ncbi:MAG: FAD-binding oxidoreductase [Saprospirales bacterium]|nr:MAG: FAD-binding oxidoreductase [Saprospirales bacterium]